MHKNTLLIIAWVALLSSLPTLFLLGFVAALSFMPLGFAGGSASSKMIVEIVMIDSVVLLATIFLIFGVYCSFKVRSVAKKNPQLKVPRSYYIGMLALFVINGLSIAYMVMPYQLRREIGDVALGAEVVLLLTLFITSVLCLYRLRKLNVTPAFSAPAQL